MTAKILEAKRKHHYVWANYLSRWSPDSNGQIFHITPKRKIELAGVRGLAREKDFYQTTALIPNETKIIKGFLKHMSTGAQNTYLSYLDNILKIQQMQLLHKENGGNDEEVEKFFFATNCNIMENLHGAHEKSADPIIAALANRELSILTDD